MDKTFLVIWIDEVGSPNLRKVLAQTAQDAFDLVQSDLPDVCYIESVWVEVT